MSKSKNFSVYTIQLELDKSDNIAKNISEIEKAFDGISESAKSINITDGLKSASNQADILSKKVKDIVENSEDATAELKAYDKAAQKSINELDKQYIKLTYSLSEQGTEQRKRLEELKEQAKAIEGNAKERKRYNDITKQIKTLEKDVVGLSDAELKAAIGENKAVRAKIKLTQTEAKLAASQKKTQTSLAKLIKDDVKGIKEKIAAQLKFIQTLKTTEGRYDAIKKAAGKVTGFAGKTAMGALKGAGIAGGLAMGLGGAAIAHAGNIEEKEKQARRIKGVNPDYRDKLLSEMYIQTGADYSTIVDAINRVQSAIVGGATLDELYSSVPIEIKYPGASAIMRQDNSRFIHSGSYKEYANKIKAIQGQTGASIEQVEASTAKIANMRQSSFSNASMVDLQALYLALQNSGAYDSQDELDRAFNSFVRAQKSQKQSVFEFAQNYNWTRGAYGAQNKQQALRAINNINFKELENAAKTEDSRDNYTKAELATQKIRSLEEKKNEILTKIFEAIYPIFEKIDIDSIGKVLTGLIDFAVKLIPPLVEIMAKLQPYVQKIVNGILSIIDWFAGNPSKDELSAGQPRANGGIVAMPSLVGEAGPEMVIPLDHSRAARASNLTQYYNQTFSMNGNETTALSLSSVVRSRDFSRAISDNISINSRLGR